jgi:tetratricopeptide (TPR) repeat protein
MNADEIRRVAEWAGFEKTPLWYTRLGYNIGDIVLDDSQNDLREYKTALEMDPDFGQAHFALGGAYGDRKLYDLAIIEMNESRRCKYGGDHDQQAAVYIAEWQQARANTPEAAEEALKTLDDALEKYPDYFPAVAAYIRIAASAGRNKPAMTRLRKLGTQLPNFLRSLHAADLHRSMRQVAQQAKGVGILKKAYDIAIAKSIAIERAGGSAAFESDLPDQPTNISVQLLAAVATLYTENQEDENALKRYQTLLEIVDQNDSLFLDSRNKMAEMYFLGAYSKEATEKEQAESLQKLIQMEKDDHSKETGALSVMRPYAGLELGKFYKLRGQDEKARPFFKERVALGMSLLEDEDAYNDYQGWGILWLTFFKAGEKDDGIAAAALWCDDLKKQLKKMSGESDEPDAKDTQSPKETKERAEKPETSTTVVTRGLPAAKGTEQAPKQDSKQIRRLPRSSAPRANASTPAVQEIIDPYPDTPWNIGTSDCPCNKSLEDNKSGLWICMFCMDMSFCDDCFKLHQEGILPYILCDSEHEFARCWGYPGGLPQSMVKVGGKVRDREEWMEEIRMKWDLPSKKVEEVENTQEVNGSKASKARKFLQKLSVKP